MNLKPLGDRVILKQDEAEVTTASGLFLASDAKEKPQTGTINKLPIKRSARLLLGAPCAREGSDGRDEKFHGEARASLAGIAVHGLGGPAGFGLYSQLGNGVAV